MAKGSPVLPRRLLRILLVVAAVLGFFIAVETGFRIVHRLRSSAGGATAFLPNPDRMWELEGHDFRDPSVSKEKAPGTFRILCMGDSSAFGFGVKIDETYSHYLGEMLKGGARRVEVINAGVPGYSSEQGVQFLRDVVSRYSPDLVTFAFLNCDSLMDTMSDPERMKREPKAVTRARRIFFMSDFYKALKKEFAPGPADGAAVFTVKSIEPRISVRRFRENLDRLGELCAGSAVRFLFINPPPDLHVPPQESYRDCIRDAARRFKVPVVDACSEWMLKPLPGLYFDFAHPTPQGHRRLAGEIFDVLQAYRLTSPSPAPVPADAPCYRKPDYPPADAAGFEDSLYPGSRLSFSARYPLPPWTCFQAVMETKDPKERVMQHYRHVPLAGRFDQGPTEDTLLADYLIHTQYPAQEIDRGCMVLISESRKTHACTVSLVALKKSP